MVLAPFIDLLSDLVRVSVAIFFTLIIVACKVSRFPVASNPFVASVVTFPSIWLLILLLVSLKIFLPVSNFGFDMVLGLGI